MKLILLLITILFLLNAHSQTKIYFDFDRYQLKPTAKSKIDSTLSQPSAIDSIVLTGHGDTIGNAVYNYWLALHRAEAIKKYCLEQHLLQGNKIRYKSDGEQNSLDDSKNYRSVDIKIYYTPSSSAEIEKIETIQSNTEDKTILTKDSTPVDSNDLVVSNFIPGKKLRLKNIHFKPGTALLYDQKAFDELKMLVQILKQNPTIKIDIQGHVCCTNNFTLSKERAIAVYNYLIRNGINKNRLTYSAYSNTQPLAPETTNENRQLNRRVEILVTEK